MVRPDEITGLILAGGQSTRMQRAGHVPVDKGLVRLGNRPLVAWVHDDLKGKVGAMWVSANRSQPVYAGYGRVLADDPVYGESAGPLAGVATALRQLETPWLLTMPVDTPVVPADWVQQLISCVHDGARLASAVTDEGAFPLCMLLHRDLALSLHAFLLSGQRKVRRWQALVEGREAYFNACQVAFFNVNTPADLQALEERLSLGEGSPEA